MKKVDRLEKEKLFHNKRFETDEDLRKKTDKYYLVNEHLVDRYVEIISKLCLNQLTLEYGCGIGSQSERWLQFGAKLTGIDISEAGIQKAKSNIEASEYEAQYFVMNAEETSFDKDTFDLVIGSGIIHHLELKKSYRELARICKPNAHIVFLEPLGHNPFINLYRFLTPELRTEDEHPLTLNDLKLLGSYFKNVEVEYFSLFSLLAVPFRNTFLFDGLYALFRNIDSIILSLPFIKKYAWMCLIQASNPVKNS